MVAMSQLLSAGASLREVKIDHLEWVRLVELLTIGPEMATSQFENLKKYGPQYGADTRLLLALASQTTAVDYLRAQRLRTEIDLAFGSALQEVDALITPTTAISAAPIQTDALKFGESDPELLDALTAFAFPANLTGLPALSVPAGYDDAGLPVGLQIIGRHWQEWTVCDIGAAVEASTRLQKPQIFYDLLED
jgi:Asp-tRNA(Asn)/Glu-tRNA(Gln) amidotransferase A subunit family amidase